MTAPTHSWLRTGLRFCASCVTTVICWAIWLVLAVLLAVLIYVALARDLPVPGFVLRRVEAGLARSGLALQFGRAHFDPKGQILLEDVQVRAKPFEEPLLTCRLLYVRHDFWSVLSGWNLPELIRIEGAALQLPAMLSTTGAAEPVVSDLVAVLRHEGRLWHVDQFAGHLGSLALTVQGEISGLAPKKPGGTPLTLEAIKAAYLRTARHFAQAMHQLDHLDQPSLAVRLQAGEAGNTADFLFTSASVRMPGEQPLVVGPVVAATQLRLADPGPQTVSIHVMTPRLDRGEYAAEFVRAILKAEVDTGHFTGRALELQAAAGLVSGQNEITLGPRVTADLSAWPIVRSTVATQIDGEFLAAEVEAHLKEQSAKIHAEGRVAPELINRVLARHTPRAAPYFLMGDAVAFSADAVLAPGWRFDRLASRVDAGRLDSRGVKITAARGRIDIVGTSFLAHDAFVSMGENEARGSYWMNFATTDYRMLLEGRLRPVDINGWFRGDWWQAFWNRYFAFPVEPPVAEVDVQGRWRDPSLSNNFVHATVRSARVWGGDFEHVDATVFVRPGFVDGIAAHGTRAQGTQEIKGTFKRFGLPNSRDTARFEFDLTTNADPAVLGRMLEGRADEVLASLRFTSPPLVHAWGAIDGPRPAYRFTGDVRDSLHYFGFPLESAKVKGAVTGNEVQIEEAAFTLAGGTGTGRASLTGAPGARRLGFDAFLNKANLGRTIRAVQEYEANRLGQPYVPAVEGKFIRQAANSSLDVALSAQGDPASVASFAGTGNAALTGAELGEVHLFGLLSQVLSGLSLSFSSLKLDEARSSFNLSDGTLFFRDLKVTGPSAVIDARGNYTIATNALDFSAKFKPYEQPGSLLAAAVSLVINPLTSILELKLGGRLDDPKWSVSLGSSSAPNAPPAKPPEPKPATDDPAAK
ncbi:MAG TPA: AsmA-like C-terminal region-containing protein [Lacunisphaera sp.]|nr:AsmA-like C-terminal region-containing protein [Lacunisphaera sp.]